MRNILILLLLVASLGLVQTGCDIREATIVYDVEFPRADSDEAQGGGGGGGSGGGSGGGPVTPTNPNGSGASYTVSKTITNVYEDHSDNDSFTIVLGKAPTADVYMGVTNPDTTEVLVSPTSVVFGTGNWSTAQTISLVGVEDGIADGNLSTNLTVYIDNSTDADYDTGIPNATVEVNSIDSSSVSSLNIASTGGTNSVTESSGVTDSFTVVLATRPAQNVTVTLTSADTGEVTVAPASLTFGSGNYSTPQTVILTAVEDNITDGNQTINVSANATSTDISYNALSQNISVTVVDSGNAPPAAITNLAAVAGTQLNTLTWSKPSGTTSYILYWSTSSPVTTGSSNFTILSGDTLTYTHAGLTAGTQYFYAIVASNSYGASGLSNEVNGTPSSYSGCNTSGNLVDNDTSIILHYGFNNNLEDNKDTFGDSRYDLSNQNGTIKYAQSCAYGQAAYFDSTTGYLENTSFDDSSNNNLFTSGNFTIGLWFLADADMGEFSSMIASKQVSGVGNDGGNWSFQLDTDGSDKIRWRSSQGAEVNNPYITHTKTTSTYAKNQWYHATFVKQDNGTGQVYINGVLQATSTGIQHTPMKRFRVGANRAVGKAWKGYIDEVKVYNKAFDGDDVKNACLLYSQCTGLTPAAPDNLTATAASSSQINLSWNPVNGVTNYTIEWGTSSGSYTGGTINTVNTTYSHTGRTASTTYYYRIKANNSAGSSSWSSEVSATTPAPIGITATASGGSTSVTESGRETYADSIALYAKTMIGMSSSGTSGFLGITSDSSNNIYVSGETSVGLDGANQGGNDAFVAKFDSKMHRLWTRQIGATNIQASRDVAVDSAGNVYLVGHTSSVDNVDGQTGSGLSPLYDVFITKYNSSGVKQWTRQFAGKAQHIKAAVNSSREVYAIGMTAHEMGGATRISTNASLYDAFIARYDSSGNPIAVGGDNATLFGTSRTDWPRDIAFDSSGNYYITGTTEGAFAGKTNSAQMEDVFIRKYNSNHTVAWTVQYDDSDSSRTNRDYGNGIAVDSSNNVFIVGTHSSGLFSNSTTGSGIFVSKHNGSNGSQIWFKSLDGSGQTDVGLQIGLDSSGNVYVSGYSDSTDDWGGEPAQHSSSYKPWIAKLNNSNGNQIWLRKMSISRSGSLQAVLDNGTIYLAGGNSDDSIFFADGEYKNHLIMMDGTSTLSQSSFDGRDNVSFVLNSQPTSTVTVNLTSADTGEFTLSTSTLSFSTSNWNTPQQVLVYAVQDNDTSDGNQNVNLNYSSTSSDSNYNSLSGSLSVTVVNAAAPVPSEPYLLTATGGSGQVALTWEPPLTGASSYTVYYSTDNSSFTAISPNVTNENYTHTGLAAGTAYYYYVKANNVTGSSGESNRANATTASARTVNLSKSGASLAENGGTVTLTATLSASSSANTSVTLSLSGNATINSDYTLSDNITISAGATTGTATLTGLNDSTDDDNETIVVDISAVSGGEGASENGTQQQTVNIIDDDVSTPSISVTPSNEKNTISWSVIPGANRYVLYWSTSAGVSASDSPFYISGGSTTSYIHGGLTGGTTYYYRLKAVEGSNSSALSTEVSGQPTVGCSTTEQTDNDTDLLVHYDFNNNLNDVKNANGDGRYNLINTGGTIKYARGCGHGNAAYYDSTTGYAYNDNFTHNNIPTLTGNFTISLWVNGDEDNQDFSAVYSSGSRSSSNHQINVDDSDHLRMLFYNTGGADPGFNQNNITDANAITNGRWYYLTAVHTDANQWSLYKDAVVVGTQTAKSTWDRLKIGINRNTDIRWKGYIDEFKVYGRSLTKEEVIDKCLAYAECDNVSPNIPTNLTATGGNLQVALSWDNMTGANNYTVYWSTDNSSFNTISPAVSGTTYTHTGRNPATIYYYKVAANNSAGTRDNSTVVSATTLSAPVVTLSGTASVNEGNSGTTNATVTASLSRTASADTTVTLTASGTATASADYTLSSSTITISAGNTTGTTTVGVLGDTTTEDNETVILDITGVSGGDSASESGVQNATVTIIDDDISLFGDFNIDNITQDFNRLSLGWDAPSNFDNSSDTYTFYWTTVAPGSRVPANRLVDASDNATPIILGTKSMYVHGTLDHTKTYYYRLGARDTSNGNILKLSTNEVSGSPLPVECTSTASSSTINDTDPDLLVYYPLNSDLLDKSAQGSRSSSDGWPFNLSSNAGGSISFGEGCAYGNSAYFDGSGQLDGTRHNGSFGYNDNFSNSDIPDNWTISVWLNPDGDLEKFSSVLSTGDNNNGPNLQIDVDDQYEPVGRIRVFNKISPDNKLVGPRIYIGNWYHVVLVHEADDDVYFYVNGTLRDSATGWMKVCNSSSSPTCSPTRNQWDRIKIGINRYGDNNWKGFIDEVKIFGRSLSAAEIEALYQKTLPPIVENLTLDTSTSGQIQLQWSAVPGSTSYTIYKVEQSLGGLIDVITFDQNNLNSSSASLQTITNVASGCVSGTCSHTDASLITNKWYYYRIAAVNGRGTGNVAPAAEVSARAN